MKEVYLAIDIGASSGRLIAGWLENGKLNTEEVFRFPNGVKKSPEGAVWDVEELFTNVKEGIRRAFGKYSCVRSLAIDTWGVDYVIMNGDEAVMPCRAYREPCTETAVGEVHKRIPLTRLYEITGIQFQPFNTVYQLTRDAISGKLDMVSDFLMIPEYLTYRLTGVKAKEYTNATTTGLVNVVTGEFDDEILDALDMLPARLFGALRKPGEIVGKLLPEVAKEVGGDVEVRLAPSHDTASAVEALEGEGPYISSGTWSLLGIKSAKAHTDEKSRLANWSNEGGVGYIRYQKNITGLWLVQSLRKELCPDESFDDVARKAEASSFAGVIDADDPRFLAPDSMTAAFRGYFGEGSAPVTHGDYFRAAFYGLAHAYAKALKELESVCGRRFEELTITGGGAKNGYLNRITQEVCGLKVKAVPIEATAIGNLKSQLGRKNDELL